MEGESRKRKVENDEDDEEKMEKFFALIRRGRDVRKRLINGVDKSQEEEEEEKTKKKKKKKKGEEETPVRVWNPSFQPGDFMEGQQASLAGPSNRQQDETKEEDKAGGGGEEGLDLKLSL